MRFFRTPNGKAPVEESLLRMGSEDRAELANKLKALQQRGIESFRNRVKPLGERLFELKWGRFRVLFALDQGEPVLMDAFIKKSKAEQSRIIVKVRKWMETIH